MLLGEKLAVNLRRDLPEGRKIPNFDREFRSANQADQWIVGVNR